MAAYQRFMSHFVAVGFARAPGSRTTYVWSGRDGLDLEVFHGRAPMSTGSVARIQVWWSILGQRGREILPQGIDVFVPEFHRIAHSLRLEIVAQQPEGAKLEIHTAMGLVEELDPASAVLEEGTDLIDHYGRVAAANAREFASAVCSQHGMVHYLSHPEELTQRWPAMVVRGPYHDAALAWYSSQDD